MKPQDFLVTDSTYVVFQNHDVFMGRFRLAFSDNGTDIFYTGRRTNQFSRRNPIPGLLTTSITRYPYPFDRYDEEQVNLGLGSAVFGRGPRNFVIPMRNGPVIADALHGTIAMDYSQDLRTTFTRAFENFWSRNESLAKVSTISRYLPRVPTNFIQYVHRMEDSARNIQRICATNDTLDVVVWNDTRWIGSRIPFGTDPTRRHELAFFVVSSVGDLNVLETLQSVRRDDGTPIAFQ